MSLINVSGSDYLESLNSVVYDHEEERFINNSNSERRFALHLRCEDIEIENIYITDSIQVIMGKISERTYRHILKIDEKLLDIINSSPSFQENSEEILTILSSVRQKSNGDYIIRLDIDDDPESRSYFFELDKTSNSSEPDVNELEIETLQPGMKLDAVLHITVDIDEIKCESTITSVIEEAQVIREKVKKNKRKPMLLSAAATTTNNNSNV